MPANASINYQCFTTVPMTGHRPCVINLYSFDTISMYKSHFYNKITILNYNFYGGDINFWSKLLFGRSAYKDGSDLFSVICVHGRH